MALPVICNQFNTALRRKRDPSEHFQMSVLTLLQQCFTGVETHDHDVHAYMPYNDQEEGLSRLPDELIVEIASQLPRRDLCRLRRSCKRLAIMTTHLLAAHCHTNRTCINGMGRLIEGSRVPLLNGTVTSLTLLSTSWMNPLTSYGAGLREVRLLRLTTLHLHAVRIAQSKDLLHFLNSHAASLRQLYLRNVHLTDVSSWREVLIHISKMHRLQRLQLNHLVYTSGRRTFMLPHSTFGKCSLVQDESKEYDPESRLISKESSHDPAVAYGPQEIGNLIDGFFTDTGELQKDFDHELMLATQQEEGWMQMVKRQLMGN